MVDVQFLRAVHMTFQTSIHTLEAWIIQAFTSDALSYIFPWESLSISVPMLKGQAAFEDSIL